MMECLRLWALFWEWAWYLEEHGHRVESEENDPTIVRSQNGRGTRYRWLLLWAEKPARRLRALERRRVRTELETGKKGREHVYVVVAFERPTNRLLIVPAARALRLPVLSSDKGGIPWEW